MKYRIPAGITLLAVLFSGCKFNMRGGLTTVVPLKSPLTSVSPNPGNVSSGGGGGNTGGGGGSGGSGSGGGGTGGGGGNSAFPGTVTISSPDLPKLPAAKSWYSATNSAANYMVTAIATNRAADPSALTTAQKCPTGGGTPPPCTDGDFTAMISLCTMDKANVCAKAAVKTYPDLNGALGMLPYATVMAQVCKGGSMVAYMPSSKLNTSAMPFGYKNRPGQLVVGAVSGNTGDKITVSVTGAVLYKNGDETSTDKITLNAAFNGLQVYSPPACTK